MYSLFARRFKELRKTKMLSQAAIGLELGVTKGTVSVWERGIRIPRYQDFPQIADYFGVSQSYLLGMDEVNFNVGESNLTELVHFLPALSPRAQQMAQDFLEYLLELEGFKVDEQPSNRK